MTTSERAPDDVRRHERTPLSRERILGAATALADADGLGVVTMRHVAAELGVEAMSLYHHVKGKEALLDGLVDVVADEVREEIARRELPHDDWRAVVRERCLAARVVMLRHPWAPGLLGTRTSIPPGVFILYEEVLGAMIRGGCSYRLGHRAMHALGSMVLGFTQELFSPADAGGSLDDAEQAAAEFAAMAEALPHVTRMVAEELHDATDPTLGWCDSQTEFEFTLDLLLDGLERVRIT
jgi:AcrR family transcriptional regulator